MVCLMTAFVSMRVWAADPPADSEALEEVIVTAGKRAESLQKVDQSIGVLSQETLEKMGASQFSDYYRFVPSLSLLDRGPGFSTVAIRGITSLSVVTAGTTSVYFDEMPVSHAGFQPDLDAVDLDRVEVLRGPQGTLYGEGAMGGTVRIITHKADPTAISADFTAAGATTEHGGGSSAWSGVFNLPLVRDRLALRLVGYDRNDAGWVNNVLGSSHVNCLQTSGGRASVFARLTDSLTLTAVALTQDQHNGGTQSIDSSLGPYLQSRLNRENSSDRYHQYNITLQYDTGPLGVLTSSTSYFDRMFDFARDLQALADDLGATGARITTSLPTYAVAEEVRLVSASGGGLEYALGAYFDHTLQGDRENVYLNDVPLPLISADSRASTTQYALFGESSVLLPQQWKVTAGLRAFDLSLRLPGGEAATPAARGLTPKFSIDHQFDSAHMVYLQAAKGFREGGANDATSPGVKPTYRPDHVWNYEVGMKTHLEPLRTTVNLAAYYIDWSDIQVSVPDPNASYLNYIDNAGKAHSAGLEAEVTAHPLRALELQATLGYNSAVLHSLSRDGEPIYFRSRLPNVPRVVASLSADLTHNLAAGITGFARLDYSYTGTSFNTVSDTLPGATPPVLQPSYNLLNIRLGVRGLRGFGPFSNDLELYADNLFDKRAALYIDPNLSSPGNEVVTVNRPRTIGIRVRIRY